MQYVIRNISQAAETLTVTHFRAESSAHRPKVSARLNYDDKGIHGVFQVEDRFVRSVRTEYFGEVWKDSCVEFFVQPKPGKGYFNVEMNAGGAHLCSYITDHTRVPGGFKEFVKLPAEIGKTIRVQSSMPAVIEPEITEAVAWSVKFFVPFALLEHYVGPIGEVRGQTWRGNFYKCADESSQRHWASWSPVDQLNFHLPHCFGTLLFE